MKSDTEYCSNHQEVEYNEWTRGRTSPGHWWDREKTFKKSLAEKWIYPTKRTESVDARFVRLADEWSRNTGHISSVSDLINDPIYQEIISLGWPAVPFLLGDLERNKRFWFPALAAITGLRPFDSKDLGNYRLMTDAWLRWGRRKGLI
jgi:hypothetical protein